MLLNRVLGAPKGRADSLGLSLSVCAPILANWVLAPITPPGSLLKRDNSCFSCGSLAFERLFRGRFF